MRNQTFDNIVLAGGGASTGAAIVSAFASVIGLASLPVFLPFLGAVFGFILTLNFDKSERKSKN